MKKTIFKEVAAWGKKVGTNVWNSTKDAPGKAKNIAKDQFSKIHQSDSYKRYSYGLFGFIIKKLIRHLRDFCMISLFILLIES